LQGDKKPGKGGSEKPNGPSGEYGIASKMQARSVNPAAEADRKVSRRCRRVKGRIEEWASTGTEADAHWSIDPQRDKSRGGEQRAHVTPSPDAMF
jgi:hypothetical protein